MAYPDRSVQGGCRVARTRKALVALCCSVPVLAVQAASVSAQDALRQPNSLETPGAGDKALDRALRVDTSTGQRNLDLLLDARTAGDSVGAAEPPPVDQPEARRAAMQRLQTQAQAQVQAAPTVVPGLATPTASARLLPTGEPGAATPREWLGAVPSAVGLTGGAGQAALPGVPLVADTGFLPQRTGSTSPWQPDTGPGGGAIMALMHALREHRYWLLGGLAVAGLLVAGIQAFSRRSPLRQHVRPDPAMQTVEQHRSRSRDRSRRRR